LNPRFLHEIPGGLSGTGTDFSSSFSVFCHFFILLYYHPMRYVIALTKKYHFLGPKLGASCLNQRLAGLGVKVGLEGVED
jgi:hypothetical protein